MLVMETEYLQVLGNQSCSSCNLIPESGVEDRMLIFSIKQLLDALREAGTVFSDGTFKMAPTPFKQIYILRAESDGVYVTVAYILLTCKKEALHLKMFKQLKAMCPGLDIRHIWAYD